MLPGVSQRKLLAVISRIVGGQDAEDVLQSAYLKILRFVPREGTNLEAWAVTVAKNEARDFVRKKRREAEWQLLPDAYDVAPEEQDREDLPPRFLPTEARKMHKEDAGIASFELRDDSARKLKSINPQWAEALLVYHRLGSLEEAAAHLEITVTALKKRMFQGRKALRT
jgi:RNA polymerase sigma factor (sigma-70 family)